MSVVELSTFEQFSLYGVLAIAIGALVYALFLRRQILKEPTGSEKLFL